MFKNQWHGRACFGVQSADGQPPGLSPWLRNIMPYRIREKDVVNPVAEQIASMTTGIDGLGQR